MFRALEHDLDTREARAAFTPTDTLQGVQIHIQEESTVFPSGRAPAQVNGPNLKISSPQVTFALGIAALVPPTQLGEWELGIVQTVISADRQLRRRINGAEIATRIWLPSSFNDRGPGVTPPWFDKTDVEELSRPFQLVRMTLYDSPGMNWDQEPGEVVTRLSGRDEFRTWLLLRKKDGSTKQFLKMWSWHVDYTLNEQGPGAGVVFDGLAPHPTGGEAILDGPPATTAYRKEVRQLPRTEFVTSFEQMRRGAT